MMPLKISPTTPTLPFSISEPSIENDSTRQMAPSQTGDLIIFPEEDEGERYEVWEVPTKAKTRYLSHDYFRYIGKFPPQIPQQFIEQYSQPGDLILDPMCGGGTVLIEARLAGRNAMGVDVNPVSLLISRVTTTALDSEMANLLATQFLQDLADNVESIHQASTGARIKPQLTLDTFQIQPQSELIPLGALPPLPNLQGLEKYFEAETLWGMQVFFALLKREAYAPIHDFLLLALLSVLRTISHANVKKMNLELDMEKTTRKSLVPALKSKIQKMLLINSDLEKAFSPLQPQVFEGTAEATHLENDSIQLAVVHPPYITNTAFCEVTQLQLAVLGIPHKNIWRRELRARGSFLHEPDGIRKYLVGWNKVLKEMHRVLRPGGHCAVVVGDGQVDYARIPVGVITAEFAKDLGFRTVCRARHRLNNNTGRTLTHKMKDQHVLVFQK